MKKKLDKLGRLVIPSEMRKELGIDEDVNLEVRNKQIIITNPRSMRTKEEIKEYMKTIDGTDDISLTIITTLQWVLKEDIK